VSNFIHKTSLVHKSAQIGENNYIGPYCLIGPNVVLGSDNRLEAYVSIGTPAEHRHYLKSIPGKVKIGDNNVFREFVTINGGTTRTTQVNNNVTILRGSHIGHDASVHSFSTLSCNVMVGGSSVICEGANVGLACSIHQFRIIGAHAMIGMNSTVTKNILPFVIAYGSPCELQRVNRIGLLRGNVSEEELIFFEKWFIETKSEFERLVLLNHPFNTHLEHFKELKTQMLEFIGNSKN
jgi:UDP-N-acetylglucosamine acyltransferase